MSMAGRMEGKSQGDRVISTKIPREEFTRLNYYCNANGETINAFLRRIVLSEIENPQPVRIAGKSIFEYNKNKDNFSWKVALDDRRMVEIDNNLPTSSVEQLLGSISKAIEERNAFIHKTKNGSVPFPTRLTGRRK